MAELPSGTVTFLFTDLEGSTRLWREYPQAMKPAMARHDAILRDAIAAHAGLVVKATGDGVHAVFADASDAVEAAVADMRSRHLGSVVLRALDRSHTSDRVPFDGATVPAGALGRYVKLHDLDAVIDT